MKKVLAIASSGGHWVQLIRISSALPYEIVYVCTDQSQESRAEGQFYRVSDFNKNSLWGIPSAFFTALKVLYKERPDVVITTGAAPGLMFILLSRFFKAKSIWVDSIANVVEPSLSFRHALRLADVCVTQSKQVAEKYNVEYWGEVL